MDEIFGIPAPLLFGQLLLGLFVGELVQALREPLGAAAVFGVYPAMHSAWAMGACGRFTTRP